ncbi:MAG: RDD family protein [Nitriliruptoraceae bacterium]
MSTTAMPARTDRGYITPDAVAIDLEVATIGSRGIAYLLDLALFAVVFLVLSLLQLALGGGGWFDSGLGIAVALVLAFAWQFGYPIGFETLWRGRTLGKAAMGLRVITVEGGPVGVRHAAIRAFTAPIELLLTTGLLASIASFVSPRAQRLGDLAAGTLVVRERRISREVAPASFPVPAGAGSYVAQLDVSMLGPREYGLVRDALLRSSQMREPARTTLLREVAEVIAPRVRPDPPQGITPEVYLQAVAAAVQARTPARRPPPPPPAAPTPPAAAPSTGRDASSPPPAPPADGGGFRAPR